MANDTIAMTCKWEERLCPPQYDRKDVWDVLGPSYLGYVTFHLLTLYRRKIKA